MIFPLPDGKDVSYFEKHHRGSLLPLPVANQGPHGPKEWVGLGPEDGHKDYQRDGAIPLWGQAEIAGGIQPGEQEAPGVP